MRMPVGLRAVRLQTGDADRGKGEEYSSYTAAGMIAWTLYSVLELRTILDILL